MSSLLASSASTVARVLCANHRPTAATRLGSSGVLSVCRRPLSSSVSGPSVPLIGRGPLLPVRSPALHLIGARPLSLAAEDSVSAHAVVPVIDLTPYFSGGTTGKKQVAREINHACEKIGFFTITGHGVPLQTIRNMQNTTKRFFDLPLKDKETVKMTEEYPYGYSGFLGESLSTGYGDANSHPDLKECFAIGPYNPAALSPAIQWPAKPDEMQRVWLSYYKAMEGLASDLLRLFALALGIPENFFEDKIDHHRSALRALNYPETDKPILPGQLRAGAHTDYGSLTILLQDEVGGLQVTARHGVWQDIPYIPDSFIINIGDLMALWTNDKWLSTPHRVVPRKPRRQSIAFFHNVNHDHLVTCIDTCKSPSNPAKYPPILAWDHLMSKHLASVGQKKAGKH